MRRAGLHTLAWTPDLEDWRMRVRFLRRLQGATAAWPDVSDERLLETLDDWLGPYLVGMTTLERVQRMDHLTALAGPAQPSPAAGTQSVGPNTRHRAERIAHQARLFGRATRPGGAATRTIWLQRNSTHREQDGTGDAAPLVSGEAARAGDERSGQFLGERLSRGP